MIFKILFYNQYYSVETYELKEGKEWLKLQKYLVKKI